MTSSASSLQVDLSVLLPDAPDEADACVDRLIGDLSARTGVSQAHVISATVDQPARLCIHYDPTLLDLGRIREIAVGSGVRLTERYGHVLWQTGKHPHERRARTIADHLLRAPGVLDAAVSAAGTIRIEFDQNLTSEPALRALLSEFGIVIDRGGSGKNQEAVSESHKHDGLLGENSELIFALVSGVLLLAGFTVSVAFDVPEWAFLSLYVVAYMFGGFYPLREAIDTLRLGRFEIDTLMLAAAVGAAVLGKWAEGALLLFLFSIGHALEHFAMDRAKRAISALATLAPQMAEVRRGTLDTEIPVTELLVGDTIVIRPNTRISADGFILHGTSSVNQAPVTGESQPVDKTAVQDARRASLFPDSVSAESKVFAGTINGTGALEVSVTRLAADSTIARVITMVSEAETRKSPTQRFTDRFERIFVPSVLASVGLLLFAWTVIDESFSESFYRAMAVLVAASPCALAISTPSAVLSGIARAARGGVLIKGGGPMEGLGALGTIAFDKTGTLTEGKPQLTDIVPVDGISENELLATAVAIERLSDHPLAAAIVRDGMKRLGPAASPSEADGLRSITGRGITATIGAEPVHAGKAILFSEMPGPPPSPGILATVAGLEKVGRTTLIVRRGERYLGVLGLMDMPRSNAAAVVSELRALGIVKLVMLSGDNQRVADAVSGQVGLDAAWGDLMPQDKIDAVKKLRRDTDIAMVGDGVNDAPAMASANVGIAMGAAGSDVALETADVALMGDELSRLPFVIGLSRRTSRVIRQNLWISLGMVALLVPATIFGLQLGIAVLFHEGSTLLVVVNALRLLAYQDPKLRRTSL